MISLQLTMIGIQLRLMTTGLQLKLTILTTFWVASG